MARVINRLTYAGAALLLAIASIGLGVTARSVAHFPQTLPGQVPAVVYEPGPQRGFGERPGFEHPLPVVVLCHGFSGNNPMMSTLARRLASAGYATVTIEFRGHGSNPNPFASSAGAGGLQDDIDAALLYVRMQAHYDGERVVLIGHSMGAGAVLAHAQRDPGVAAVVAISGGGEPTGPYPPPNVLLVWASGDPDRSKERLRGVGALLAGREQLVADRVYGDPQRGTGVRISEVDGTDHLTILYSSVAAGRILDWLALTVGPGGSTTATPATDARFWFSLLGLLATLVLLWGLPEALAPLARRLPLATIDRPLARLGWLACALLFAIALLAGFDAGLSAGPLGFVPLLAAREIFAFFAITGLLLHVALARGARVRAEGIGDRRTWIVSGLLFALAYVGLGVCLNPFGNLLPAPHRLLWCGLGTLVLLPYFAATEWLLRGPGAAGVWLPIAGKLLTLLALGGGALSGLLPFVVLLGIGPIALSFAIFELVAYRSSRLVPNPWVPAIFQAAFLATSFAAVFPFTG